MIIVLAKNPFRNPKLLKIDFKKIQCKQCLKCLAFSKNLIIIFITLKHLKNVDTWPNAILGT